MQSVTAPIEADDGAATFNRITTAEYMAACTQSLGSN